MFKKLPLDLQDEAKECIAVLASNPRHPSLRTHKLKGHLGGRWSCSVNYAYRIIFRYVDAREIALLAIGDHDVYR